MSILDFTAPKTQQTSRTPFAGLTSVGHANYGERPKAKVWLNVGYEKNGKFINLPIGLPIDTMEAGEVRGQNEDWVKQRTAQNELLKALQAMGAAFAPGQEETINLTIKLRRVNEQLEVAKDQNEYSFDPASLLVAAE
ncbi:hypothetical protein [Mesorhizobium sp. M4B.F.Ca.ET.058.02.1.1]|uniref:hypothetical protein n=1 Tax=Mesorhizobium sp. M4B.F.Ca.ET.058.02.1.1 TaxID=2493675 RepID=UPI000F76454C|nr:hypothetical protein [Mesorhizobium sp. M4B.F.Ca.ET.058.02.1.1]AZO48065.1 hypothetical protein EJ073_09730 [Mesorhizobium sp. M4B.F.Ca.ET.058.02.1.1]